MPRLEAAELTDQAIAQHVEIADGVEDLVLDEFVLVTQAVFVQYTKLIHHDGVIHTAAECQVLRTQELDVTHETEGARTADFLDKRRTGKAHAGRLGAVAENRA